MGMMSPAQASVAQLDRVLPSEGRGRGFESRRVHQIEMKKPQVERPGAFFWGVDLERMQVYDYGTCQRNTISRRPES